MIYHIQEYCNNIYQIWCNENRWKPANRNKNQSIHVESYWTLFRMKEVVVEIPAYIKKILITVRINLATFHDQPPTGISNYIGQIWRDVCYEGNTLVIQFLSGDRLHIFKQQSFSLKRWTSGLAREKQNWSFGDHMVRRTGDNISNSHKARW